MWLFSDVRTDRTYTCQVVLSLNQQTGAFQHAPCTNAVFSSQLGLTLACHPTGRAAPLCGGWWREKPKKKFAVEEIGHSHNLLGGWLLARWSTESLINSLYLGLMGFSGLSLSAWNTTKTSQALGYTGATHKAGPCWVWAPGCVFTCWKLSGLISLSLRHIFFPPWKLIKIHVVVLMPTGSCRILLASAPLPSSWIHHPQIGGHRCVLLNLYWRLMYLPKWVCHTNEIN